MELTDIIHDAAGIGRLHPKESICKQRMFSKKKVWLFSLNLQNWPMKQDALNFGVQKDRQSEKLFWKNM